MEVNEILVVQWLKHTVRDRPMLWGGDGLEVKVFFSPVHKA